MSAAPEAHPISILLIEDNPADARLVEEFLREGEGAPVIVKRVDQLQEALAHLKNGSFNAIILDLNLPDSQGLATFVRTHAEASDAPILVLTGLPDQELAMAAVREGAQDYLVKGQVDGRVLSRALRYAIQRKQAESSVRWLTQAVDQSPDSVFMTDLHGTIQYVNQRFTQVTGYTSAEAIGRNPRILKSDLTPVEYHRALWETILAGKTWRGEVQNRRKNGELYWDAVTVSPIRDARGVMTHFLAAQKDITEQRRAEGALRESNDRFRQLVDNIREVFFITDAHTGQALYVSPAYEHIWGRSCESARATPFAWAEAVHPEDLERVRASLAASVGRAKSENLFRILRPDGTIRWIRSRTSPVAEPSGDGRRVVAVAEDVTELRQIEHQLQQAQKMEAVGRLAGGVAHDFNNLLTVIFGECDMLLEDVAAGHPARQPLTEIRKAAERAAALTRQLLTFSRRQLVELTVFNPNTLVADVENMLRRLIGEDVELKIRLDAGLGAVKADRGQIEQVLVNLVVNARDAMPQGGTLAIETANVSLGEDYAESHAEVAPGEYVMLSVSDTGTGMTDEVKQHLFEPFFTTKERGKGTGLGLATSYAIAKQFGGHIGVYSELGVGSILRVYVPLAAEAPRADPPTAAVAQGGNETILLVEDEEVVRRMAARMLSVRGYVVLQAGDGEEALRVLASHAGPVHLLLTDVVLPKMGGRILADQVRAARPDTRILFASGYTDDVILQHRMLERPIKLIQKPYTADALARKVRAALDEPLDAL